MIANYWTLCWKCNQQIKSKEDCNSLKTPNGNFNLCPACYEEFIKNNTQFLRPEITRLEEMNRSLYMAMSDFHEKMMEQDSHHIRESGTKKVPAVLIHNGYHVLECEACIEIKNARCSVKCTNQKEEE